MKNEFFSKILKKPLIIILVFSVWPFFTFLIPSSFVRYLPIFYIVQAALVLNYVRLFIIYLRYLKFPNYEEARIYYYDLRRVKRHEKKAKKVSIKKEKETIRFNLQKQKEEKRKLKEAERAEVSNKLKLALEERKKKVL
jgi:hypothetical protein